jgi:trimeric autotransporter adhesin
VALTSLALNPTSLTPGPGVASVATVTLTKPAPTGGVVLALASNDPLVTVPASVTIPMGATTGTFNAAAVDPVASSSPVAISATYSGVTKTAIVTLLPAVASSLSPASPMKIEAGATGTVTLTLTGPAQADAAVTVASSDVAKVSASGDFTITAGHASGTFTVSDAGGEGSVATITVTAGGVPKTLTVDVVAAASASVVAFPGDVALAVGNTSPAVAIVLDADVAADTAITVANSDSTVASVSADASVLAGSHTAALTATALKVGSTTIGVSVNGGAVRSFTVTVGP